MEFSHWVSRTFLVPKPTGSGWHLVVDLREINKACQTRKMKMETLWSLRLIAKPSDHWVNFDLKDGFYSLAITPQDIESFYYQLRRQAAPKFFSFFRRATDGLEPQSVCFLEARGGVHRPP